MDEPDLNIPLQPETVPALEISQQPPRRTPLPADADARAAIGAHCRSTVANNDKIGAIVLVANAVVLGLSLLASDSVARRSSTMPLLATGLGLFVGSICLLLGGRYSGRASARRHLQAELYRRADRESTIDEGDELPDPNAAEAIRYERAQQRFATTYDWLIASAEILFVAGLICTIVFAALLVAR